MYTICGSFVVAAKKCCTFQGVMYIRKGCVGLPCLGALHTGPNQQGSHATQVSARGRRQICIGSDLDGVVNKTFNILVRPMTLKILKLCQCLSRLVHKPKCPQGNELGQICQFLPYPSPGALTGTHWHLHWWTVPILYLMHCVTPFYSTSAQIDQPCLPLKRY